MATQYETIGYPILGEAQKEEKNVIGYNVREEQSISTFSVLGNASGTTTGEATLIYGLNAPKIIAETSIIGGEAEQKVYAFGGTTRLGFRKYFDGYSSETFRFYDFALYDTWGNEGFEQTAEGLKVKVAGGYLFHFNHEWIAGSEACIRYLTANGKDVYSFEGSYAKYNAYNTEIDKVISLSKGDILTYEMEYQWNSSSAYNASVYDVITISKI